MNQMNQLLKQAQAMQQKMMEAQQKLETLEVEGQSGGGMVKVTVSGKGIMQRISIDKSLLDPAEGEMLEDLVVAASKDAAKKAEEAAAAQMSSVTGGLQLPPGMKMPF